MPCVNCGKSYPHKRIDTPETLCDDCLNEEIHDRTFISWEDDQREIEQVMNPIGKTQPVFYD